MTEQTYRAADPSDLASEEEQRLRDEQIRAALNKPVETLPAKGFCHYCDDPVGAGARFCSPECRDDHDYEKTRKAINGRR
ncbi:hypothetical protein D3C86_1818480 [compost metagenome]